MLFFSKILLFFILFELNSCEKQENDDKRNWNGTWFPQNPNAAIKKLESFQKTLIDVNENNNATGVWKGKWFPHEPHPDAEPLKHEKTQLKKHPDLIKMGVADPVCDDGNTNLATDFDPNDVTFHEEFLCTRPFKFKEFKPNKTRKAHHLSYNIPKGYRFNHICMNETIEYKENIPTYGDHRKLWAAWGEYKFLPKQRWIHNLEHGGIVMLYHPCALQYEVQKLKDIVANCLYRHIITPYSDLTAERPLALVAWENSVEMSVVSTEIAVSFIRKYALQAPEKLPDQGQYQHMLIKNSTIISDYHDSRLCPYQLELNGDKNGPF